MYKIVLTLMSVAMATTAAADVYRWRDAQGKVYYGAHPPASVHATAVGVDSPSAELVSGLRPGERTMLDGIRSADSRGPRERANTSDIQTVAMQCRRAREQELGLRERMRSGYKARDYNGLMAASRRARQERRRYCR
jgi:hypothetical protein